MNLPPSCFFEVNEMGNNESTWSGLSYAKTKVSRKHIHICLFIERLMSLDMLLWDRL